MNLMRIAAAGRIPLLVTLLLSADALAAPAKVDAAAYDSHANEYYFFSGDAVFTKPRKGGMGAPRAIADVFSNWPESWTGSIDAATYYDRRKVFYFFRGSEYASAPVGGPVSEPKKIVGNWNGWPQEFGEGDLDAIIYSTKQKRFYYFKNQQFSRHKAGKGPNPATGMDVSNCLGIMCDGAGFPGWPFRGSIDAASYVDKDKNYYFYAGGGYGVKPYGKAFGAHGSIQGDFANWPEQEAVAAFSHEPAPDSTVVQDESDYDAIKLLIQTGHTDAVKYVNYLDESRIVSIGLDGISRIWDVNTGKETHRLGEYTNPAEVFALVDEQRRWLLLADTEQVTQWDIETLERIRVYPIFGIRSMEIHGDYLSVLFPRESSSSQVRVINLETAETATTRIVVGKTGKNHGGGLTSETSAPNFMYADHHPGNGLVVSSSTDAKIRLWSKNGKRPREFGLQPSAGRKTGKFLVGILSSAVGGTAGAVGGEIGDALTEGAAHAADRVVFSPDGSQIVSGHLNGKVAIWSLKGKRIRVIDAHEGRIHDIRFSPDGSRLLTTGSDGLINIWDFHTGELQRSLKGGRGVGHVGTVTTAAFSPDGTMILSGGEDKSVLLWDENGAIARNFVGRAPAVSFVRFHPDNETFITADRFDPFIRVWNISDATLERSIPVGSAAGITATALSPDGRLIAVGNIERKVAAFDLDTGEMLWQHYHREGDGVAQSTQRSFAAMLGVEELYDDEMLGRIGVGSIEFTPDSSRIVSVADNSVNAIMWDATSGQQIKKSGGKMGFGAQMDVSSSGAVALSLDLQADGASWESNPTVTRSSQIVIWTQDGTGNGKLNVLGSAFASGTDPKRQYRGFMTDLEFHPDGRHLIGVAGSDLAMWNVEREERVQGYFGHEGDVIALKVDPTGAVLVTGSSDNTARSWDIASGKETGRFAGHTARIFDLDISADGRYLITGGADGTARLWSIDGQQELASFTGVGREDYIVNTSEYFYTASKGAASGLAFSKSGKSYPFDQFDLQLNRPDLVVTRIDRADPYLRSAYSQAAQKRMRKYGIRGTTQITGDLPSLSIDSQIPLSSSQKTIEVSVTATDAAVPVSHLLVSVNDVPVYGSTGLPLEGGLREVRKTVPVTLSNGRNKLQFSVRNSDGYESLRETTEITYVGEAVPQDLHVAVVGVSDYMDEAIPDLTYPTKDANDIADTFASRSQFANVHEYRLLDGEATKANIEALRTKLENTRVDDQVVIFIAGHGLLDDNLDYFFAPTDLQLEQISSTGVSYETLEGLLDGIPARNKLLMMDTCHAGDADAEARRQVAKQGKSGRALKVSVVEKTTVIDRPSMPAIEAAGVFDLMKSLFVNLDRGSGSVVISAAASNQYALESAEWQNGVFTYSVLDGIRTRRADRDENGEISASELHRHVATMVEDLTGGEQVPTTRREQSEFDFRVF